VVPVQNFNSENDAKTLREAMKGAGTNEQAVNLILANRSAKQRLQIALMFKTMYGKDLIKDLKSETSGNYEALIVRLIMDPASFDATCLYKAMKGVGTDENALIEVLLTRNNAEIDAIKVAFKKLYNHDLEAWLISETSGHFKRLVISAVQGNRNENTVVDQALAKQEAKELYSAGEKKWGTDESKFNQILMLRSFPQLRATFAEYRIVSQYDIAKTIDHEMSGDLAVAFKTVIQCVKDKPTYFAERLHKAMKGMGTDDEALIRIVVARSEIDMVEIKRAYFDKYNKSLKKMIQDDTSGDYKSLLCALVKD
jgi:annexin A7/11